jgi:hypothetical protein
MKNLSPSGQILSYDLAIPNNITGGTAGFFVPFGFLTFSFCQIDMKINPFLVLLIVLAAIY